MVTPTRADIKRAIIDTLGLQGLTPDMIDDEAPLFGPPDADGAGLGLDSIDALELLVVFEKDFGVSVETEDIDFEAFSSVASLEAFVQRFQGRAPGANLHPV
jgi:acyl carrier protein